MSRELVPQGAALDMALAEQGLTAVDRTKVEAVVNDFNEALDLIFRYQRSLYILNSPDPCILQANALLKKYGREPYGASPSFRIIVDDVDITEHSERETTAILEEEFQAVIRHQDEIESHD